MDSSHVHCWGQQLSFLFVSRGGVRTQLAVKVCGSTFSRWCCPYLLSAARARMSLPAPAGCSATTQYCLHMVLPSPAYSSPTCWLTSSLNRQASPNSASSTCQGQLPLGSRSGRKPAKASKEPAGASGTRMDTCWSKMPVGTCRHGGWVGERVEVGWRVDGDVYWESCLQPQSVSHRACCHVTMFSPPTHGMPTAWPEPTGCSVIPPPSAPLRNITHRLLNQDADPVAVGVIQHLGLAMEDGNHGDAICEGAGSRRSRSEVRVCRMGTMGMPYAMAQAAGELDQSSEYAGG